MLNLSSTSFGEHGNETNHYGVSDSAAIWLKAQAVCNCAHTTLGTVAHSAHRRHDERRRGDAFAQLARVRHYQAGIERIPIGWGWWLGWDYGRC